MKLLRITLLLLMIWGAGHMILPAQCMIYEVDLPTRIVNSEHIVLGRLVEKHPFETTDANIYTLNIVEVTSWLKGYQAVDKVGVITVGGVVGDRAQVSHPALSLDPWNEYVLFLEGDKGTLENPAYRQQNPGIVQSLTYADAQGAITKQLGKFHDLLSEPVHTEASLLARIQDITGIVPVTPEGEAFTPREGDTFPLTLWSEGNVQKVTAISNFSPDPTNAGTINPADFLTINGSGFGGTPGTIFYSNADDGGATFTASGVASDNLSWTGIQIQNKPAGNAGTGPINVNGAMTSATDLTVNYAFIDINSSFAGFGSTQRQNFKHVDTDGSGGYTFFYNSAFATNAPAVAAFDRALETWVCATNINFKMSGSTTGVSSVGNDGTNAVFFDATLPAGVLGRASSFFQASATGACNNTNTVWWSAGIDVQFKPDPPAGCCTWNFGPGASAFLQFDFESVAVHELGHAHGLGHVIAPGEVMHFALSNGTDTRTLTANDISGGNQKMTLNLQPLCFAPAGVNGNMTTLSLPACILNAADLELSAVRQSGQTVLLDWEYNQTDFEGNFVVERSTEGVNFEALGELMGDKTATESSAFQFLDVNAADHLDWFYRLQVVDRNGNVSYSPSVKVAKVGEDYFEVFPSVTAGILHLKGSVANASACEFQLVSPTGQLVSQLSWQETGEIQTEADFSDLPAGLYVYRFSAENFRKTGRILIQR